MVFKVCGMREKGNIADVAALNPTMMGFIMYDKSPRYVGVKALPATPEDVMRVGVFVNAEMQHIMDMVNYHDLDFVQLHGSESVKMCEALRKADVGVIKAISVAAEGDIKKAAEYAECVDCLLFDTKCEEHGGSGKRFDWSLLESYEELGLDTPYMLSGGIDDTMADEINELAARYENFAGVDLNSRFEVEPALKDVKKLEAFVAQLDIDDLSDLEDLEE
ncbi:MAG: phosphoribosylanthranilate isomerase [Rikenellaceae bacterium]